MKGLFVTGTGTDIGKTYASALIMKKLLENNKNATYYKAAVSGNDIVDGKLIPGDAKFVCDMSGLDENPEDLVSFVFEKAISPHLAEELEDGNIEMEVIKRDFNKALNSHDFTLVEGSGGIICPISRKKENIMLEDIVRELNLPSIIVADSGLGTINGCVLTAFYMKSKGLKVNGIVFNNYEDTIMHRDNLKMVEQITGIKVIGIIRKGSKDIEANIEDIVALFEEV